MILDRLYFLYPEKKIPALEKFYILHAIINISKLTKIEPDWIQIVEFILMLNLKN